MAENKKILHLNMENVYVLKVKLTDQKKIWRRIEVLATQTLSDLHDIIFEAFNRYDPHLYAFWVYPLEKKPTGRGWTRGMVSYQGSFGGEADLDGAIDAEKTTLGSLYLRTGQYMEYLFDFGDDWMHEIVVEDIAEKEASKKYPYIKDSKGESPPQYEPCEDA